MVQVLFISLLFRIRGSEFIDKEEQVLGLSAHPKSGRSHLQKTGSLFHSDLCVSSCVCLQGEMVPLKS